MANSSDVKLQHKPFHVLRNLEKGHADPKGVDVISSKSVGASYEAISEQVTTNFQHDPSRIKLHLSVVIRKLRSSDHHVVLQAIEELRARGCLSDGTLAWICLRYANLQRANLSTANLKSVDLHKANLEMADLSYANLDNAKLTRATMRMVNLDKTSLDGASLIGANLQGAKNVSNEQLARAGKMRGSILPDGNLYDGRFNLPGDFADASILHVDLNNLTAIAEFYGVSLEDFLCGQKWRQVHHMPSISAWHESVCFQNAELIMKWL